MQEDQIFGLETSEIHVHFENHMGFKLTNDAFIIESALVEGNINTNIGNVMVEAKRLSDGVVQVVETDEKGHY